MSGAHAPLPRSMPDSVGLNQDLEQGTTIVANVQPHPDHVGYVSLATVATASAAATATTC